MPSLPTTCRSDLSPFPGENGRRILTAEAAFPQRGSSVRATGCLPRNPARRRGGAGRGGAWSPGVWPITGPGSGAEAAPAQVAKDAGGCCWAGTKFPATCGGRGAGGSPPPQEPRACGCGGLRCFQICVLGLLQQSVSAVLEAQVAHLSSRLSLSFP